MNIGPLELVLILAAATVVGLVVRGVRKNPDAVTTANFTVDIAEAQFVPRALPTLAGVLSQFGYALQSQADTSAFLARRRSPWYFWLVYVLFFPIGLVLLLARPTQTVALTWTQESQSSTTVTATGDDRRLARIAAACEKSLTTGATAA